MNSTKVIALLEVCLMPTTQILTVHLVCYAVMMDVVKWSQFAYVLVKFRHQNYLVRLKITVLVKISTLNTFRKVDLCPKVCKYQ